MISSFIAPLVFALLGFVQGPTPPKIPSVRVSDGLKQTIEIQTQDGTPSSFRMVANMHFVVLPLDSSPLADPILEGVTDEEGRAVLELPEGAFRMKKNGRLWAHVYLREEGKQARRAEFLYPGDLGYSSNALSIDVLDGCTSFGRTLDSDGNPVDAHLSLREQGGPYIPTGVGETTRYINLHGGWHVVHHEEPLTISGKVQAPRVGTAKFEGLELACPSSRMPFEVVLSGEGVLRGTLFNQAGDPSAGVSLKFTRDSDDTGAPGNLSGYSTTDKHGRFLVSGLKPGSYKVQRKGRKVTQAIRDLLDPLRFQADGEDIRLTIPRFHLEVSLRSNGGGAWTAGPIYPGGLFSPNMRKRFDETKWPEEPTLVVVDAGHERDAGLADRRRLRGSTHADDRYTFELQAGHSYWVGVLGGDFAVHFDKITVTEAQAHYILQLTPVEAQAFGHIRAGTRETPKGRSKRLSTSDTDLWIESPTGGVRLLNTQFRTDSLDSKLPVGRYRVVAHGTPRYRDCGNAPFVGRKLGFEEAIIEIRKGETTIVGLGIKQGALLKATVTSTGNVSIPSSEIEAHDWLLSPAPPAEPYATMHLEHSARRSESVFHDEVEGHASRSPSPYWRLSQTITSERLPYGDYTLVVTRCDGKIERRPVHLRSGETTEITVAFAGQ